MQINWELKNKFEQFTQTEFIGKLINSNKQNRNRWFFVQAGTDFGNKLHYEYNKGYVELHIEKPDSEDFQQFLYSRIIEQDYKWEWWNKPNYKCRLIDIISNETELFEAFNKIRNKIEPIIEEFEKSVNIPTNDLRTMMTSDETIEIAQESVVLHTKTLGELFQIDEDENSNLELPLAIPDYQRIYCWSEKNVHRLLDDIINNKDKPYHLGSIILHKSKNHEQNYVYNIVDGQQRMVTLALLLLEFGKGENVKLLEEKFESTEAQSYIAYNKSLISNFAHKNQGISTDKILNSLKFSVLIINDGSLDLAYTFFSIQEVNH